MLSSLVQTFEDLWRENQRRAISAAPLLTAKGALISVEVCEEFCSSAA